jgi:hypothetical protein
LAKSGNLRIFLENTGVIDEINNSRMAGFFGNTGAKDKTKNPGELIL